MKEIFHHDSMFKMGTQMLDMAHPETMPLGGW